LEYKKREDFSPELVEAFARWACGTEKMPHKCIEEAMERFHLSESDVWSLLHITAVYWVF